MTYSIDTLQAQSDRPEAPGRLSRFAQELSLIFGLLTLSFWLLCLLSYSANDPAWSTTGDAAGSAAGAVRNWGGRFGALLADHSYFLLGLSVWWLVALGVSLWLTGLRRWLSGAPAAPSNWRKRVAVGLGLLALMVASAALEWTRLYRFEAFLPGHAGGVLGYWVGPAALKWLGFAG